MRHAWLQAERSRCIEGLERRLNILTLSFEDKEYSQLGKNDGSGEQVKIPITACTQTPRRSRKAFEDQIEGTMEVYQLRHKDSGCVHLEETAFLSKSEAAATSMFGIRTKYNLLDVGENKKKGATLFMGSKNTSGPSRSNKFELNQACAGTHYATPTASIQELHAKDLFIDPDRTLPMDDDNMAVNDSNMGNTVLRGCSSSSDSNVTRTAVDNMASEASRRLNAGTLIPKLAFNSVPMAAKSCDHSDSHSLRPGSARRRATAEHSMCARYPRPCSARLPVASCLPSSVKATALPCFDRCIDFRELERTWTRTPRVRVSSAKYRSESSTKTTRTHHMESSSTYTPQFHLGPIKMGKEASNSQFVNGDSTSIHSGKDQRANLQTDSHRNLKVCHKDTEQAPVVMPTKTDSEVEESCCNKQHQAPPVQMRRPCSPSSPHHQSRCPSSPRQSMQFLQTRSEEDREIEEIEIQIMPSNQRDLAIDLRKVFRDSSGPGSSRTLTRSRRKLLQKMSSGMELDTNLQV